ncbi:MULTISPECIES: hypothetical protein [Asticcacaulis]|uniref:hypothetical protein n=1 Tax=Asticcacaulis TaxID=76890 RepID=UPI001AE6F1FB|nr:MULTISPECIES: hypothetical protein [Asticcacaulis]MBP2159548.1 hypothetical protein [Asticcacaulis solisilvae]MDR6800625.1 hypothetical protein [Asticcacaulis sp. BE141]
MPVGGAIVAASAIGANAVSGAAKKSQKAAQYAADKNEATIKQTQADNTALLSPFVQGGTKAQGAYENFLGLNGAQSQDAAFNAWRDSTGYKDTLNQGLDALNSNLALKGQLKSGTAMKSAIGYGGKVANSFGQQYLGNLQTLVGNGLNAAGSNVNANSNAAGMAVNNNNFLANATATNAFTSAGATNQFLSDIAKTYGDYGGAKMDSSYNVFGTGRKKPTGFGAYGRDGGYGYNPWELN